jgi:hypothetical protein
MLNLHIDPDYCQKGPGRVERWRFDPEEERGYTHRFSIPRRAFEPIEIPTQIMVENIMGETPDLINNAIVIEIINKRQEEIFKIIRSGLKNYEFEFETDEEFRDFCARRVIRAGYLDSEVKSYYLDGENQLICVIDEAINLSSFEKLMKNEQ